MEGFSNDEKICRDDNETEIYCLKRNPARQRNRCSRHRAAPVAAACVVPLYLELASKGVTVVSAEKFTEPSHARADRVQ